jgi:hypothetical protein
MADYNEDIEQWLTEQTQALRAGRSNELDFENLAKEIDGLREGERREKRDTLRWKIDKDVDLYKFYLDVSVKASVFLMAVTGGIASYVLSNHGNPIISIALAFPAVVNGGFTIFFFNSITEAKRIARVHGEASKELGVQEFNMNPLRSVCQIFGLMCAVATLGLFLLMAFELRNG